MEQVFVIIAVVVFFIVRGLAGAQRRGLPGQDPFEDSGAAGTTDIAGATRHQTMDAQERAIEALSRWEEKQGLSRREQGAAVPTAVEAVPAVSRTRAARPSPHKQRFKVPTPAEATAAAMDRASSASWDAGAKEGDRHESADAPAAASRRKRSKPEVKAARAARKAGLPGLETLPLAARAIVYGEILGPPRSLS